MKILHTKVPKNTLAFLAVMIFALVIFFGWAFYLKAQINQKYESAIEMLQNGQYEDARDVFNSLGNYKDSISKLNESLNYLKYDEANKLFEKKCYQDAAKIFSTLGEFEDSQALAKESMYYYAVDLYEDEKYEEAFSRFQELEGYEDSNLYIANITLHLQEEMKERIFNKANELFQSGEYRSALDELAKIEDYPKSAELKQKCNDMLARLRLSHTISAGIRGSVALKSDGTIIYTGDEMENQVLPLVGTKFVSVACFGIATIGLEENGKVIASDVPGINVDEWENIIAVDAGQAYVVGLKNDGTVEALGHNGDGQCNVKQWTDIVAIATGWRHTVGLKSDGTVEITGNVSATHRNEVEQWTDIVAIAAGGGSSKGPGKGHTVGLKADGTVVTAGDNSCGQRNVDAWKDKKIVAIAAGDWHTVGLTDDGRVVVAGCYGNSVDGAACDTAEWEDIVAISANYGYTLGLTSDGTILSTGYDAQNQRPISEPWKDIMICKEWDVFSKGSQTPKTIS